MNDQLTVLTEVIVVCNIKCDPTPVNEANNILSYLRKYA